MDGSCVIAASNIRKAFSFVDIEMARCKIRHHFATTGGPVKVANRALGSSNEI